MVLGLGIGMTVGFTVHKLTCCEKKSDFKKKIDKAVKAASALLSNL